MGVEEPPIWPMRSRVVYSVRRDSGMDACHPGTGRSHKKYANDPKKVSRLSSWIVNVPHPTTQRSMDLGERTMNEVSNLRLSIRCTAPPTWGHSVSFYGPDRGFRGNTGCVGTECCGAFVGAESRSERESGYGPLVPAATGCSVLRGSAHGGTEFTEEDERRGVGTVAERS